MSVKASDGQNDYKLIYINILNSAQGLHPCSDQSLSVG